MAPAPEGIEKPFAVNESCVRPDWTALALPRLPETVPQRTWVSVTATPVGPRIDQVTPNVELLETEEGYEFTEMNGWLRALIAFKTFTRPLPKLGLYGRWAPAGWTAVLLRMFHSSTFVRAGSTERINAAAPVTNGVENEVPWRQWTLVGWLFPPLSVTIRVPGSDRASP